ncbi:MAG: HAD family phosphatase [Parachlamydia sp.]|nr:HAD family phosphatase [Parachlamydia sp.]
MMKSILYCLLLILPFSSGWAKEDLPYKAVIFDFGGVIATYDRALEIDFVMNSLNIKRKDAIGLLKKVQEMELQEENAYEYLLQFVHSHGLNSYQSRFWLRQWNHIVSIALKEIPGMLDLVTALNKKGLITAMFSNVTSHQAKVIAKTGYYDYFDPLFLSHELKVEKPDLKAYKLVLKQLALPAQECLFIDDRPENIEAAIQMGMDGILFESPTQLVGELYKRGIKVHVRSIPKPVPEAVPHAS